MSKTFHSCHYSERVGLLGSVDSRYNLMLERLLLEAERDLRDVAWRCKIESMKVRVMKAKPRVEIASWL
jgi:hypothetical protein